MVSRSVVVLKTRDRAFGRSNVDINHVLDLRKWCYENAKGPWRSYFIDQSSEVSPLDRHPFMVFEFDHNKDAMLFRLYTGIGT